VAGQKRSVGAGLVAVGVIRKEKSRKEGNLYWTLGGGRDPISRQNSGDFGIP
jgi:hypothetical protein